LYHFLEALIFHAVPINAAIDRQFFRAGLPRHRSPRDVSAGGCGDPCKSLSNETKMMRLRDAADALAGALRARDFGARLTRMSLSCFM
jgi:hypothetical protein